MSSQRIYLYYPHYNSSLDIIPNLNSNENLKNDTLYDYDSFQNKEDKEKVFNEFFDFSLNKHSLRNDFNDDDDENRYTINKTRENTQTKVRLRLLRSTKSCSKPIKGKRSRIFLQTVRDQETVTRIPSSRSSQSPLILTRLSPALSPRFSESA